MIRCVSLAWLAAATATSSAVSAQERQTWTLPNGLALVVERGGARGVAALDLTFRLPAVDASAAEALAAARARAWRKLEEEAGRLGDPVRGAGGTLAMTSGPGRISFSATVPSERVPAAMGLLAVLFDAEPADGRPSTEAWAGLGGEGRSDEDRSPYAEARPALDALVRGVTFEPTAAGATPIEGSAVASLERRLWTTAGARLAVVGDVDSGAVRGWAAVALGRVPPGADPEVATTPPRREGSGRLVLEDAAAAAPLVLMGFPTPAAGDPAAPAVAATARILADRLRRAASDEGTTVRDAIATLEPGAEGGLLVVGGVGRSGTTAAALEESLRRVVSELVRRGPSADEVESARADLRLRAAAIRSTSEARAAALQREWLLDAPPAGTAPVPGAAEIEAASRSVLRGEPAAVVVMRPEAVR